MSAARFILLITFAVLFFSAGNVLSQSPETIQLPTPQTEGGKTLFNVLNERHSSRSFSDKSLSDQTLSNLLWAAFGVNRPDEKKRTAPSAWNSQEIDIYVSTKDGLFLYNAFENSLSQILKEDVREATGVQSFVKDAAVNLVYVINNSKISGKSDNVEYIFSAISAGAIIENVYLFCSSEGLATVTRGLMNKEKLAKIIGITDSSLILMAQSVGYPAE